MVETIKFSDLIQITEIADDDILAITDSSNGDSRKISVSQFRDFINPGQTYADDANQIITAINNYIGDGVDADKFDGQDSTYFLNYNNLTNKPNFISDFFNDLNFARILFPTAGAVGNTKLVFDNSGASGPGGQASAVSDLTTDYIFEGSNNKYFKDEYIATFFDQNFGDYFAAFSSTFEEGLSLDSVYDARGVFAPASLSLADLQTNIINVIGNEDRFKVNQTVRIYGASDNTGSAITQNPIGMTLSVEGAADQIESISANSFDNGRADHAKFSYKAALFDPKTGEFSSASQEFVVYFGVVDTVSLGNNALDIFNIDRFIKITFNNIPEGKGVLLYRKVDGTSTINNNQRNIDTEFHLCNVLTSKDIISNIWNDYFTSSYVTWSGKNNFDNGYRGTDIIHFPLLAPLVSERGWIDRKITQTQLISGGVRIILDSTFVISSASADTNNPRECRISHNDTGAINAAIQTNLSQNKKALQLNPKSYVASGINMPNNFSLQGSPYITKITKLPWSTVDYQEGLNNSIIRVSNADDSNDDAINSSIVGIDIAGNSLNQFLVDDTSITSANYAVDFRFNAKSCLFDRVRISKPIGGGFFCVNSEDLKIINSEALDSGLADLFAYSPVQASSGKNTIITGNSFANFSDFVDVSATDTGVVGNNIIRNCGSGLFVYGSRFMLASSNVLAGPADEFIPVPDSLNSEFDEININLNTSAAGNVQYISTNYSYQENGEPVDLRLDNAAGLHNRVYYTKFAIQKTADGAEEVYDTYTPLTFELNDKIPTPEAVGVEPLSDGIYRSLGQFGFTITAEDVQSIKNASGAFSYSTLKSNNDNHVGLGYAAVCERLIKAADLSTTNAQRLTSTTMTIYMTNNQPYISEGSYIELNPGSIDGLSILGSFSPFDKYRARVIDVATPIAGQSVIPITIDFEKAIVNSVGDTINYATRFASGITFSNLPAGTNDTLIFTFDVNDFDIDVDSTLAPGDTVILGGFTEERSINGFDMRDLNGRVVAISAIDTVNNTISIVTLMDGQDDAGTGAATWSPSHFGEPYLRYVSSSGAENNSFTIQDNQTINIVDRFVMAQGRIQ